MFGLSRQNTSFELMLSIRDMTRLGHVSGVSVASSYVMIEIARVEGARTMIEARFDVSSHDDCTRGELENDSIQSFMFMRAGARKVNQNLRPCSLMQMTGEPVTRVVADPSHFRRAIEIKIEKPSN